MIIKNITIKAFKSIHHLSLPLDPHATVLIGPNESGKTNILKAIERFRPDLQLTNDLTCQYSDYYQQGKTPQITVQLSQFTKEEKAKLVSIYDGFRNIESFSIRREGPRISDYKVFTGDKALAIGNIKPIFDLFPKILFFNTISVLKDCISLEELLDENANAQTERNLLKIGGIDDINMIFEDSTRGRRAAEEASREITARIVEVWSQEPTLEIKLRVNGQLLYIDFSDSTTVYDTPRSRSHGFLWYLSFYINFIAATNEAKTNEYFFLFDEPGVHLHPSGQKDLTHLLDSLSSKNQLVFTTHSPFMINREFPHRVRVVTKDEHGTTIQNEAYKENWKPLRQSIGLTVGDLFFFSSKGIIVELPTKPAKKGSIFGGKS